MLWPAYWSRLLVWIVVIVFVSAFPPSHGLVAGFDQHLLTQPFHSTLLNRLLAPAGRYDSVWYLEIAKHGYFSKQATAFFPLYPLLIHVLTWPLRQPLIAGLVISLIAMVAAFEALYRLAAVDYGESVARVTVVLVALFPMSLFLSAVYTEALFMALSIGAIYAARRDRWAWAGVFGACAAATRSDGVAVLVALAVMFLYGPRELLPQRLTKRWWEPRYRLSWQALWLALVPAGLVAYMVYCAATQGDALAPFHAAAQYWGRTFNGPLSEIWTAIGDVPGDITKLSNHAASVFAYGDPLNWTSQNLIDIGWIPLVLIGLIASARKLPLAYTLYAAAIILASASNPSPLEPMMSFARYLMPAFPLFLGPATWLARHRGPRWTTYGVFALGLAALSALWGVWYWVA